MRGRILPAILIALTLGGCAGTVIVENPPPLQAAPDPRVTAHAIRQALASRGWAIAKEHPGSITAMLMIRTHQLHAEITYDARAVYVSYLGSANLKAQQRGAVIYAHRKVNLWMANLQRDIGTFLAQSHHGPPPPVHPGPPPAPPGAAPGY